MTKLQQAILKLGAVQSLLWDIIPPVGDRDLGLELIKDYHEDLSKAVERLDWAITFLKEHEAETRKKTSTLNKEV